MTVAELIDLLQKMPNPAAPVIAFDVDANQYQEVSGVIFGGASGDDAVQIQTDDLDAGETA